MFTRSANTKAFVTNTHSTINSKTPSSVSTTVTTKARSKDMGKPDDHVESLDELLLRMERMFENTNTRIEASVENCKRDLQTEINTLRAEVQQIKTECSSEIRSLSDTVKEVANDVRSNKQRILVGERINDLLLSGVPYNSSEDLLSHVSKIANALGFDEANVPLIYAKRLARSPIAAGATPPIILQFAFKLARDEFYSRYLSSRNLSLAHLGFDVDKRIFINENLTEEMRRVKALAVKMKKSGKLVSVYTRNGTVFIKTSQNAAAKPIFSEDKLAE